MSKLKLPCVGVCACDCTPFMARSVELYHKDPIHQPVNRKQKPYSNLINSHSSFMHSRKSLSLKSVQKKSSRRSFKLESILGMLPLQHISYFKVQNKKIYLTNIAAGQSKQRIHLIINHKPFSLFGKKKQQKNRKSCTNQSRAASNKHYP